MIFIKRFKQIKEAQLKLEEAQTEMLSEIKGYLYEILKVLKNGQIKPYKRKI